MGTLAASPNFGISPVYGADPQQSPKSIPMKLDFSTASSFVVDFSYLIAKTFINLIQTVYIDNAAGTASVSISFDGTQQVLTCPPNSQGYFPILSLTQAKCTVSSTGTAVVNVQFLNIPIVPNVWGTLAGGGASVSISGPLPLPTVAPINTAYAAVQLTLTTGFQEVFTILHAANSAITSTARNLTVQSSLSNAAGTVITMSDSGSSPGLELSPGGSVSYDGIDLTKLFVKGSVALLCNFQVLV